MGDARLTQKLVNMPLRGGLMTAGHRAIVPENSLWKAKNLTYNIDGTIQKRPGISNWNSIAFKTPAALTGAQSWSFRAPLYDLDDWDVQAGSLANINVFNGELQVAVDTSAGPATQYISYAVPAGVPITVGEYSVRLTVRVHNLDSNPASMAADSFGFALGEGTNGYHFQFYDDGLYYWNSGTTWTLVSGSADAVDGKPHAIEVHITDLGNALVYLDDVLIDTIATASMLKTIIAGGAGNFHFLCGQAAGRNAYTAAAWNVMWANNVTDPFDAVTITNVTDFDIITESGAVSRFILAAAGNDVLQDVNFSQQLKLLYSGKYASTAFARFRNRLILINHDDGSKSTVSSWDGTGTPVEQSDAPNIRFATEHKTRLWGAGNVKHPLRLYYSASRQEGAWFDPDVDGDETFEEAINAGYLEIPPRGGSHITAVFGDYYGQLIVFTDRGVWRVSGSGPTDFAVQAAISNTEGCVGPEALTIVGNDLWFISTSGVYSLQGTDQFGDLITRAVSAPILDLWSDSKFSQSATNLTQLSSARLTYIDRLAQILMALPADISNTPSTVYVYSLANEGWIGPWDVESIGLANVVTGFPLKLTTMMGGSGGYLRYVNPSRHTDATGNYNIELELPLLNGRSVRDTRNVGASVSFNRMRLFFQLRGDWKFYLTVLKDGRKIWDAEPRSQGQAVHFPSVDKDFRVDSPSGGIITDEELVIPVEFSLPGTGNYLSVRIETDVAEEHFVLQGYEIDFQAASNVQGAY